MYLALTVLCLLSPAVAFPDGAGMQACENVLTPNHNDIEGQTSASPYQVIVNVVQPEDGSVPLVYPGDEVEVTLVGPNHFRGFILAAISMGADGEEFLVGEFRVDPENEGYTHSMCDGTAITHTLGWRNSAESELVAYWKSPANVFTGDVTFHATFVEEFDTFWVNVLGDSSVGVAHVMPAFFIPEQEPGSSSTASDVATQSTTTGSTSSTTAGSTRSTTTGFTRSTTTGSTESTTGSTWSTTAGSTKSRTTGFTSSTTTGFVTSTTTGFTRSTTTGSTENTPTGFTGSTTTGSTGSTTTGSTENTPTGFTGSTTTGSTENTPTDFTRSTTTGSTENTPTGFTGSTTTGSTGSTTTGSTGSTTSGSTGSSIGILYAESTTTGPTESTVTGFTGSAATDSTVSSTGTLFAESTTNGSSPSLSTDFVEYSESNFTANSTGVYAEGSAYNFTVNATTDFMEITSTGSLVSSTDFDTEAGANTGDEITDRSKCFPTESNFKCLKRNVALGVDRLMHSLEKMQKFLNVSNTGSSSSR